MQIDTIQETEDDQVYRMHLSNKFSVIFKIIGPNSSEWTVVQPNNILVRSKVVICFHDRERKWIEVCRRPENTSKETMIQLAKSLIPTMFQSFVDD